MNTDMAPKHKEKAYTYMPHNRDRWWFVLEREGQGLSCLAEQLSDSHA